MNTLQEFMCESIENLPYVPPLATPLYWMYEGGDIIKPSVMAFLGVTNGGTITPQQVQIVRAYLDYVIHAPCWECQGKSDKLTKVREEIKKLKSNTEALPLIKWVSSCLAIGIDPL